MPCGVEIVQGVLPRLPSRARSAIVSLDARLGPGVLRCPVALARLLLATALVVPRLVVACEPAPAGSPFDGLCAVVSGPCTRAPHVAVLSAFPAEQRMLRAAAKVTERLEIGGRPVLVGWLAGQRVVLTLTGIGLVNATTSTKALIAHLDVSAIVFSGVAGSQQRIGDVVVPLTWINVATGHSFAVDPGLLADAEAVAAGDPVLGRCTPVPPVPPGPEVCLPHVPRVVVGGRGESSDPFGGRPFLCLPGGGEVLGCDPESLVTSAAADESTADAVDEESAAVADVAAGGGVPFLIVRGVSDGAGDPLGLPGFPAQFFAYYRLAADNAATVGVRVLATLPRSGAATAGRGHVHPRPAAACAFERAAAAECRGVSAPRQVARLVSQACALRAGAAQERPPSADRLADRAATRWRRAAAFVERSDLPGCCAATLAARLRAAAAAVSAHSS